MCFELAYVLLTDVIIIQALKAAIMLNFRKSILPTLDVGLSLDLERNLSNIGLDHGTNTLDQDGSCQCKNISVRTKIWVRAKISDLSYVNAALLLHEKFLSCCKCVLKYVFAPP